MYTAAVCDAVKTKLVQEHSINCLVCNCWLRGTVVECRSFLANFPCPAHILQLMGDHVCG